MRDLGSIIQAELAASKKDFDWLCVSSVDEVLDHAGSRQPKHIMIRRILSEAGTRFPGQDREFLACALFSLIKR